MNKLAVSLFFGLFFSSISFTYSQTILNYFNISEAGGKIFLNWQIKGGSTCNGVTIYHATDTLHFKEIGSIAGICGSTSQPISYAFTHQTPEKNRVNYYKLNLGNFEQSKIVAIQVIDTSPGYNILPNPSNKLATIYFSNTSNTLHKLTVYTLSGRFLLQAETKLNNFQLQTADLSSGSYFFSISNQNKQLITKGKLIVAH